MKGISTILAVILIVIIVVALVSLTYTFAVGLFGTATRGATTGTEAVTKRLQQSVAFVGATCDSTTDVVKFTIRHTGTENMISGDMSALINGAIVITNPDITLQSLTAGQVKEFNYTGAYNPDQIITITVSAPAASVDQTAKCLA